MSVTRIGKYKKRKEMNYNRFKKSICIVLSHFINNTYKKKHLDRKKEISTSIAYGLGFDKLMCLEKCDEIKKMVDTKGLLFVVTYLETKHKCTFENILGYLFHTGIVWFPKPYSQNRKKPEIIILNCVVCGKEMPAKNTRRKFCDDCYKDKLRKKGRDYMKKKKLEKQQQKIVRQIYV